MQKYKIHSNAKQNNVKNAIILLVSEKGIRVASKAVAKGQKSMVDKHYETDEWFGLDIIPNICLSGSYRKILI